MRNLDDILKKARQVIGTPGEDSAADPASTNGGSAPAAPATPSDSPLETQLPSTEDILPPGFSLELPEEAPAASPPPVETPIAAMPAAAPAEPPAPPAQPFGPPPEPAVEPASVQPVVESTPEPPPPAPAEPEAPPVISRPEAPPVISRPEAPPVNTHEEAPPVITHQEAPPVITHHVPETPPPVVAPTTPIVSRPAPASPDPVPASPTTPPAEEPPGLRPADGVVQDNSRIDKILHGGQPMSQPQSTTSGQGLGGAMPQVPSGNTPNRIAAQPTGSTGPSLQQALGKGLDIGTANLVSATQNEGGIQLNLQRNAFIDVQSDVYTKNMLTKLGVPYAVQGDRLYVLGDASFELANIFGRETRRPMQKGLISPSEVDALPVIRLLIERVLGHPTVAGEKLYFSVPAAPIDSDLNVVYHEGIFKGLLSKLGYDAQPIVEGHAVTLAELADENFTGIGISCGGGMFNICVSYKTIPALSFSTSRAGDWVDQNVAAVCGTPVSKATLVKEEGVDLMNPVGREQEACSIYYRNLINYTLVNIKHRFESSEGMPVFREPVSIVCSGGTSLVGNFIECFKEEFQKVSFPIPVREIRLADNPLMVVAKGALIAAALGD